MQRCAAAPGERVSTDVGGGVERNDDQGLFPVNEATARLSIDDGGRERRCRVDENSNSLSCNKLDLVPVAFRAQRASSNSDECLSAKNLDPNLWAFLPDHLLDRVLAFLPFWSIFRLRSVSKKWNRNLASAEFLDRNDKPSSREILFIMFADFVQLKAAATYNPTLNKWHLIPLSLFSPYKPPTDFTILATAGGLICLEEIGWPNREISVSNPMNRSYKKLPPMLHMKRPYVVGMMMDDESGGYRILVAQDGESLTSQYYESKSDSWKMNADLNRRVAVIAGITSIEGFFFCLTFGPIGLVAYNIKEASWHDLQVRIPSAIVVPHVIEYNRQLVVVGGVEEYGSLTSIRIWQLNLSSQECDEVERMPDDLFHKLTSSCRDHFVCVGEAGLICFNNGTYSDFLMYSMAEKKWWWLPTCPLVSSLKRHSGYTFKPVGFSMELQFGVKA